MTATGARAGLSKSALVVAAIVTVGLATTIVVFLVTRDDSNEAFGREPALEVAEAHFAAFNAGDAEAAIASFAEDVTFSNNFTGSEEFDFSIQQLEWGVAQGTVKSPVQCAPVDEGPDESVLVSCSHGTHDAVAQAAGAPAVTTTTKLTVTQAGIIGFAETFGSPDFGQAGEPFDRWMTVHHPEDAPSIGFGNWNSVETAIVNGELTAQFAAEWAVYLDANECGYRDGC